MGRWSGPIAPRFLGWLAVGERLDWLDVGCGTEALSAAVLAKCNPASLVDIDGSDGFVAKGTGPAPGYRASPAPEARGGWQKLSDSLPHNADGRIALPTGAWAGRGISA